MKWVLVICVAVAVLPLVHLSMESLDNPLTQNIVVVAAGAAIFAAEHALGYAMAHLGQHWSRRARLGWLSSSPASSRCARQRQFVGPARPASLAGR